MRIFNLLVLLSALSALPVHAGPESVVYAYNIHKVSGGGSSQGPQFVRYTLGDFTAAQLITQFPFAEDAVRSISWNPELTVLYGIRSSNHDLVTVDVATGEPTVVGLLAGLNPMDDPNAMAIDDNGNCFIITDRAGTASVLYSCDLTTGAVTEIGMQTEAPILGSLTVDCSGQLYGTDITTDGFYSIDSNDGSVELIGPLGVDIQSIHGLMYDRETDQVYGQLYLGGFDNLYATIDKETGVPTVLSDASENPGGDYVGTVKNVCPNKPINPGLNGAWFNPETSGQGFLLEVLPEVEQVFLAWFTYETMATSGGQATIGDQDHRWLTALGTYSDASSVELELLNTKGGVFNSTEVVSNESVGTITLTFDSCTDGTVEYQMDSPSISGTIPIQRIANDNAALCEALR